MSCVVFTEPWCTLSSLSLPFPLSALMIEVQPCVPCPYRDSAQRPLSDIGQTQVMKSHRKKEKKKKTHNNNKTELKNPSDKLSSLFSLLSCSFSTDLRIFSAGESLWERTTDNKARRWYCHVSVAWCCLQSVPPIRQWLCAKYEKLQKAPYASFLMGNIGTKSNLFPFWHSHFAKSEQLFRSPNRRQLFA